MPPTTTTTKASAIELMSIWRLAASRGTWSAPPRPASAAPRKNTEVNSHFWLTPSAATMSRSWVAARTSLPQRVRWNSSHSAPSTSGPTAMIARLYSGEAVAQDRDRAAQPGHAWPEQLLGAPDPQRGILDHQHDAESREQLE